MQFLTPLGPQDISDALNPALLLRSLALVTFKGRYEFYV